MCCPCYIASVLPCIPHKGSLIPKSSTFQGCWGLLRCYTCLGSFRCFWEKQARIELHGLEDDFLKHSFTKYLVQYRGFSEVCAKYLTILNIIKCLELILTYSREIIPKNNSNKKPWKYKVNTKQSLVAYCNDSRKKQSSLSLKKKKNVVNVGRYPLVQGSPTPIGNQAVQQRVSWGGSEYGKLHLLLPTVPHCSLYSQTSPPLEPEL